MGGRPEQDGGFAFDLTAGRRTPPAARGRPGPLRAIRALLLTGLTSMELLAIAAGFIGTMAFLWVADLAAPERLVTEPILRGAWAVVVLALIRPLTWIPYVVALLALQRLTDLVVPGWRATWRNALANVLTLAVLAASVWAVLALAPGVRIAILSGLGFLAGTVSFEGLGHVAGRWDGGTVAIMAAVALLVRVVVPPLGLDLGLSREPVLGFVSGRRGSFDRICLVIVAAGSALLVGAGYLLR